MNNSVYQSLLSSPAKSLQDERIHWLESTCKELKAYKHQAPKRKRPAIEMIKTNYQDLLERLYYKLS